MTLLAVVTAAHPSDLVVQAVKTLIIVVFLIGGLRLLGKRMMSQLNVYDLALLMAVSNAVQNAMTGGRGNLTVGLVTSSTIVLVSWVAVRVFVRRPTLERRIVGSPVILANHGQLIRARMRRELVTPDDIDEALRVHGLDRLDQTAMVVLEVDGSLSVIPRGAVPHGAGPDHHRKRRRARKLEIGRVRHGPRRDRREH